MFLPFNKKNGGGQDTQDGGQDNPGYLDPRGSSCPGGQDKLLPGLEPMTSGLEKPALLSTRLCTIIAITKYE